MKIWNLLFLCLILLTVQSCVESVGFAFPESETQLVLMAEFSPDQDISVELSTSIAPCCGDEITFPDNAEIELFEDGELLGLLSKDRNSNRYVLEASNKPIESSKYAIKAWLPDQSVEPIRTEMTIPTTNNISDLDVLSIDTVNSSKILLEIRLFVEEPTSLPAYFNIVPTRRKNTYTIDPVSGETQIIYSNEKSDLDIVQVMSQANATFKLHHIHGLLVDFSKLRSNHVDLKLSASIDLDKELFNEIIIEMNTVTPEYYFYHKAISQSSTASGGTVPKPINIPSNIDNGLGLFAGVNTKVDSFQIQ